MSDMVAHDLCERESPAEGDWYGSDGSEQLRVFLRGTGERASIGVEYGFVGACHVFSMRILAAFHDRSFWISVASDGDRPDTLRTYGRYSIPLLVSSLFANLNRGGPDGDLYAQDWAHRLGVSQLEMLMRRELKHRMPILYISPVLVRREVISPGSLAMHLRGVTHVATTEHEWPEGEVVTCENPLATMRNHVVVFWSDQGSPLLIRARSRRYQAYAGERIAAKVISALRQRRPMPALDWGHVEERSLRP
jgi:hypothetical protein